MVDCIETCFVKMLCIFSLNGDSNYKQDTELCSCLFWIGNTKFKNLKLNVINSCGQKIDSNQAELWVLYLAYNSTIDAEILIYH